MRITFTKTRTVEDWRRGTDAEEQYEAGRTYDLPEHSAAHWIGRGVAVAAGPEAPPAPPPPEPPAEPVAIPDDWKSGSAEEVKALAQAIAGGELPRTRADAEAIVTAEVDRRAAAV